MFFKKEGFKWKRYAIYCDDFETFSKNTQYFKEHNDTNIYAISSARCDVTFDSATTRYVKKDQSRNGTIKKVFNCVNLHEYFEHFSYSNKYGKYQIHYFHNFTKFDSCFLIAWLVFEQTQFKRIIFLDKDKDVEEPSYWINDSGGKFKLVKVWLKDKNNKGMIEIEFRDSYKLFNFSIANMSKELLKIDHIDIPKTDLDVDLVQTLPNSFNELPEMIKTRVGNDALILAVWFEQRLTDGITFPIGTKIPFSIASNALDWFAHYLVEKNNLNKGEKKDVLYKALDVMKQEEREDLNLYFINNKYYKGGITSFIPKFRNTIINNINSFDVNSLYPSRCMMQLPYGLTVKKSKVLKNEKDYFVFVECFFDYAEQLVTNVPCYLNSEWADTMSQDWLTFKDKKIKYQNYYYKIECSSKAMFSLDEFNVFNNKNWFKFNFTKIKYWYFKKDYVLKEFMEENYKIKEEASKNGDAILKNSAKMKMNSLTGKFGEKPTRELRIINTEELNLDDLKKHDYLPNVEDKIRNKTDFEEQILEYIICEKIEWSNHTYLPIIAAITSLGRAKLMSTSLEYCFNHLERHWYYCDTDSGKTDFDLDEKDIHETHLGYWKKEGSVKYMKYLCAKKYCGSNDLKTFASGFFAMSGVAPDKNKQIYKLEQKNGTYLKVPINWNDFNEDLMVSCQIASKTKSGRVIIIDGEKNLMNIGRNS